MEKIIKFNQRSLRCLKKQIKKLKKKLRLVFNHQMKNKIVKYKLLKKNRVCNSIKHQFLKMRDKNRLLNINIISMISKLTDLKISWLISSARNKSFKGLQIRLLMMIILILFRKKIFKIRLKSIWKTLIFLVLPCQKQIKIN